MKKTLFEFYKIDSEKINRIWDNGIFSYDANVLLNIYRYSQEARNNVFESISYFIDRTILTYQACWEYHNNKRQVAEHLKSGYDEICQSLTEILNKASTGEITKYRKHCAIDFDKDIIKPLEVTINKIKHKLEDKKNNHDQVLNTAELDDKLAELFDGKVSQKFAEEDLKKIYAEGKKRYEQKIPPGFADFNAKKHRDDNSLYGDLIIWNHLIKLSKEEKKDIIFVTDDKKEDWWDIYKGKNNGPLPMLYREFFELTNQHILIYSVDTFIQYAASHMKKKVNPKVITEIKDIQASNNHIDRLDSPSITYLDLINQIVRDTPSRRRYSLENLTSPHLWEYTSSKDSSIENLLKANLATQAPLPKYNSDFIDYYKIPDHNK